ncbi:MAG: aldehyde dehydrogenase family protein [Thermoplasmatota archaeon]
MASRAPPRRPTPKKAQPRLVERAAGAGAMRAVEAAFAGFANENTFWHHTQNGTMAAFDAAFDKAVAKVRSELGQGHPLVIAGRDVTVPKPFTTRSPADPALVVGSWTAGTRKHAAAAVQAAHEAFPAWSGRPWQERAAILERGAELYRKNFYELCAVMCLEAGKTRYEASIDVDEAIDFLRFYALTMREFNGFSMTMGHPVPTEECRSVRRPWGVFAVVCPFNFPVAITTGMTAAALVTGNTVVLKPSGKGCLSGWMVFQLLREAGVPAGALNFLTASDHAVSTYLLESPDVDGLCLTGSKRVGFKALQSAASGPQPKPVIAEMGGKNAIVVSDKADLDKAVQGAFRSAFGFSGQKCSACSRIYVHRKVAADFTERLVKLARTARVGLPWKKESYMGPVIEEGKLALLADVAGHVARDGGKVLTGGKATGTPGNYVEPTLVTGLPLDHRVFREEFFMPFAALGVVDSFAAGIREANAVEYGLTSGCFSEDTREVEAFFAGAQAGVLYANRAAGGSTAAVVNGQSFVGWKNSGTTGNGAGGRYYLLQFTREQSHTVAR